MRADSDKLRCVWFHGAHNAGKSRVCEMLTSIFICQTLKVSEKKYTELLSCGPRSPYAT
jgi:hypothetical protein